MNLDERIEAWLDGSLDDAGCAELAQAVAADPALAVRLAEAARLDLALGVAHGRRPDLVGGVMAGLRGSESRVRLRQSVMRDLPRRRRPVRRQPWPWIALAAAAGMALALLLAQSTPSEPRLARTAPVAVVAPATLGEIVSFSPGVQVRRAGQAFAAAVGLRLLPGDALCTPEAGTAVVMACAARLELGPDSELGITSADALALARGRLDATVEPRSRPPALVFTTPQAQATVLGTVLSLAIAGDATRLEVTRGRVGLATRGRQAQVEVAAGGAAVARSGSDPEAVAAATPLFPAGLGGWIIKSGDWAWEGTVLVGSHPNVHSRLMSERSYGDFVLDCRIRISGTSGGEIQADDYRWFVRVPQEGGWHAIRLVKRAGTRIASIDGQPVGIQTETADGDHSNGPISFYVRDGASIEIADARITIQP